MCKVTHIAKLSMSISYQEIPDLLTGVAESLRHVVLQKIFDLMDRGLLVWITVFGPKGCRHLAKYKDNILCLNCCNAEGQYLLVGNKIQDLGKEGIKKLCDRIMMQQNTLTAQDLIDKLEEFNDFL